ncbi:MAG: hypothetical protein GX934_05990 [Burkholderiales bacterium]|nr:hypothetical protein [Burkholderiales bacterium]
MLNLKTPRKPSPGLGLLLSLAVYPGSGQAMNQHWGKAITFAVLFTLALVSLLYTAGLGLWRFYEALTSLVAPLSLFEALRPALWPAIATLILYVVAALDAWIEARRLTREGGDEL